MNTKQTITGKQDNSLETPRCQEKDFTLSRGWRLERGRLRGGAVRRLHLLQLPKQSSVSFSVIASPQRAASNRI